MGWQELSGLIVFLILTLLLFYIFTNFSKVAQTAIKIIERITGWERDYTSEKYWRFIERR